jgi:hypothetical protein
MSQELIHKANIKDVCTLIDQKSNEIDVVKSDLKRIRSGSTIPIKDEGMFNSAFFGSDEVILSSVSLEPGNLVCWKFEKPFNI